MFKMENHVVVEMTGIPGAGKSHLTNNIKSYFKGRYAVNVIDQNDLYREKNLHGLKKFLTGVKILLDPTYLPVFFACFSQPVKSGRKIKYLLKILFQQEYLLRRLKNQPREIYILDEGFLQLYSIYMDDRKEEKIRKRLYRLLNLYPKNVNAFVLYIDGDAEMSFKRLEQRQGKYPTSYWECPDEKAKKEYLEGFRAACERLTAGLPDYVRVMRIPADFNESDVEKICREIANQTGFEENCHDKGVKQ